MVQRSIGGSILNGVQNRPVVLLTDFGMKDGYSGVLKGVICSICPGVRIMDLSHEIAPQNIMEGSFLLSSSFSYFPKGSIFCVVVDPGVGSERKAICIETQDYFFVGPDNGILYEAASLNEIRRIVHITNPRFFLESVSNTFHGRDVFAPVAAAISCGMDDIRTLGTLLENCVQFELPKIKQTPDALELCVIHTDRFGNLILNLKQSDFARFIGNNEFCLTLKDREITRILTNYAEAIDNEIFLIVSSSSYLEISIKNFNAAQVLQAGCLDKAVLKNRCQL